MSATNHRMSAARFWAGANIPSHDTGTLTKALAIVRALPDAYSSGYSITRQARLRLEAELSKPERQTA